jgi:hypothetical protein
MVSEGNIIFIILRFVLLVLRMCQCGKGYFRTGKEFILEIQKH